MTKEVECHNRELLTEGKKKNHKINISNKILIMEKQTKENYNSAEAREMPANQKPSLHMYSFCRIIVSPFTAYDNYSA